MPNIIVFGGAFDPLHAGHIVMANFARNYMIQSFHKNYEVWITPSYFDTLGKKQLTSGHHRVNMLKLALENEYSAIQGFLICTIELESGNKMGTYELMKELKRRYPKYNFRFLMGADAAQKVRQWRNSRKFTQEMQTLIVPRIIEERLMWGSKPIMKRTITADFSWLVMGNVANQHILIPQSASSEPASSTFVRNAVAKKNWSEAKKYVCGSVLNYIKKNGLYQTEEKHGTDSKSGAHLP